MERAVVTGGVPGAFATVGTARANHTSFTDSTAVAGTVYRYRVTPYNPAGETPSNEVVVTTP